METSRFKKNLGSIVGGIVIIMLVTIRIYHGISFIDLYTYPYWSISFVYITLALALTAKVVTEELTVYLYNWQCEWLFMPVFEEDPIENWGKLKIFFWGFLFNPVTIIKFSLRWFKCFLFSIYCHCRPKNNICRQGGFVLGS